MSLSEDTMKHYCTHRRMAKIKGWKIASVGKDVEKLNLYCLLSGL
jgi:hypothetical protein